ncbi:MAG: condensation domain-containing protein, partial [Methylococcaceae bacterium]
MNTTFSLASNQRDVWYDQLAHHDSPVYNIAGYLRIEGKLDCDVLKKAFKKLVSENEALRLSVYQKNETLWQTVNDETDLELEFIDFSNVENAELVAIEWVKNSVQKPFVLGKNKKIIQFTLIKIQSNLHYLFTKYHHIIADGWSTTVTLTRLGQLYNELLKNCPCDNPTLHRYADYVQQEQDYFASEIYQRDADYWFSVIPTLPHSLIEKHYPTTLNESLPRANIYTFLLKRAFYNELTEFAQNQKSTTYHLLLSALALYFSRTTQQNEIVIGVPVLNRSGAKFRDVLGMFVSLSPLVLNINLADDSNQIMKM